MKKTPCKTNTVVRRVCYNSMETICVVLKRFTKFSIDLDVEWEEVNLIGGISSSKVEKVGKDENDMKSGCEHICFIANCGRPLRGPRHNTLELYFSEIKVLYFSLCR